MGRGGVKMPSFCLNRIRPHVRVRSPNIQFKLDLNPTKSDYHIPTAQTSGEENSGGIGTTLGPTIGRKIMLVVDSSIEAKHALQWTLTHTIQNHDILILLYVTKPCKLGDKFVKESATRVPDFICCMKNICKLKKPEVQVEIVMAEGKDKGPTVVEEAKNKEVAMLVLGQRKRSVTWRLLMIWAGNTRPGVEGVVDYCIQNAGCMAIAVRRKSKKVGGYLITTKRHKDFWLLA